MFGRSGGVLGRLGREEGIGVKLLGGGYSGWDGFFDKC